MCQPISLLMSADTCHFPPRDSWDHSHSAIAAAAGIPSGLLSDKWARVEVIPVDGKCVDAQGKPRTDVDSEAWDVILDEKREPGWWADDRPAQIERARKYAARWLAAFPANKIPGAINTGGSNSTNTGGVGSINTGGIFSINTGGVGSINTGDVDSINTGGSNSTNTGGERSVLIWRVWRVNRIRIIVAYVGESGIEPNVPYTLDDECRVVPAKRN